MYKQIEGKFYIYKAVHIHGTMDDITNKLKEINESSKRKFVFMSNIILLDNKVSTIIQYQEWR